MPSDVCKIRPDIDFSSMTKSNLSHTQNQKILLRQAFLARTRFENVTPSSPVEGVIVAGPFPLWRYRGLNISFNAQINLFDPLNVSTPGCSKKSPSPSLNFSPTSSEKFGSFHAPKFNQKSPPKLRGLGKDIYN